MEELREILTGGQSFSWIDEGDCFSATLNEKVYRVRSIDDFRADAFLYDYFDLDFDYDGARAAIASKDDMLRRAVDAFPTLRILRQDPWIALISFILSQNNNIKRITGLYHALSRAYGHEVEKGYWSFPTPRELSRTSIAELRELRVGFRDSYIMDAIDKADILAEIPALDYHDAEARLMGIRGIGKKVANCVLLFGFRGIYFATVAESNIPVAKTGAVIGLASFVGFCPDAFFYTLVGGWLDKGPSGYTMLFALCLACSILGFICCIVLGRMNARDNVEVQSSRT